MERRYKPLENFLNDIPPTRREVTLTFEELEDILGRKLPPSAYKYTAWWANDKYSTHSQTHSWMEAGWLVRKLNLKEKSVKFSRGRK